MKESSSSNSSWIEITICATLSFTVVTLFMEFLVSFLIPQSLTETYIEPAYGIRNSLKANFKTDIESPVFPGHYFKATINGNRLRRGNEVSYEKPQNTFRIMCLGDSRFFGFEVNDNQTLTHYLEKILNHFSDGIRFEVLNGSPTGWDLLGDYVYYKKEGYKYKPDLVLLNYSPNRLYSIVPFANSNLKTSNFKVETSNGKINLQNVQFDLEYTALRDFIPGLIKKIPFYTELRSSSHLFTYLLKKINVLLAPDVEAPKLMGFKEFVNSLSPKLADELIWQVDNSVEIKQNGLDNSNEFKTAIFYVFLKQMMDLAKGSGSELVTLDFPSYKKLYGLKAFLKEKFPKIVLPTNLLNLGSLDERLKTAQDQIDSPLFFPMDNHWTPAGNYIVALLTYNFLLEKNLLPEQKKVRKPVIVNSQQVTETAYLLNRNLVKFFTKIPSLLIRHSVADKTYTDNYFKAMKPELIRHLKNNNMDLRGRFELALIYLRSKNYSEAVSALSFGP